MTKRLGRGLADLIDTAAATAGSFVTLRTDQIKPNRLQPRGVVDEATLEELKASIARSGVIEPLIVRPIAHGVYELVAGERRFRAAQAAGLREVPAIVRTLSDREALEWSLIENVQREDLNPLEEATGYARLLNDFGYTQEDIAAAVGKDRTTITNLLRLLTLPEDIQAGLRQGRIALGHAKVLLSIEDRARQLAVFREAAGKGLSVRQTEALARTASTTTRRRKRPADPQLGALENELRRVLGTRVTVVARKRGGRIAIDYFSHEDLRRLLGMLGISA
jgi:ParB family chromosome partitioning protein